LFSIETWLNPPLVHNLSHGVVVGDPAADKCVGDVIGTGFSMLAPELAVGVAVSNFATANVGSSDQGQALTALFAGLADVLGFAGPAIEAFKDADTSVGLFSLIQDCAPFAQHLNKQSLNVTEVRSLDPNEKEGPMGVGPGRYIRGLNAVSYEISFENSSGATVPAQVVSVTDPLDSDNLDLTTLTLGPIAVAGQLITPARIPLSIAPLNITVDLRPVNNSLLQITGVLNVPASLLKWTFTSINPSTGLPPTDPSAGFLLPGEDGNLSFTVLPKPSIATGTVIQNTASIVFDTNSAIATPNWTNTLDNTAPTSHVAALPADESNTAFTLNWLGTDIGAGVQDYTIYVSDDGADFMAWLSNTSATSGIYSGQNGHTYGFYSIARDLAGNIEASKAAAEATTNVVIDTTPPVITSNISGTRGQNGWYRSGVTISWSATDPESGIASSAGCSTTTLSTDTAGVTLTCSATNGADLSSSASVTIRIDQTQPVISGIPPTGCNLWPPDHRLIEVAVVKASDALSGMASFNVTGSSNEPHDPNDRDDIRIEGSGLHPRTIFLRADTLGRHDDHDYYDHRDMRHHEHEGPKIYTLTATGADLAGNTTTTVSTCKVENAHQQHSNH